MKRFAQTVLLKDDPEVIRQYEYYHAHIWREVLEGTIACGIQRAFIYRFGRVLFMFMETNDDFDMERDVPKYMSHPRAAEWDRLMRDFQEPVPGAPKDGTWVQMKEVYAMDLTDPVATEELRKCAT
jgi:L-rhamnose mutarotase